MAYADGDPGRPLAWVRVCERMDGSGVWEVWLNWPAEAPREVVEHPNDKSAYAGAARLYADEPARKELGEVYGVDPERILWRIRQPDGY